MSDCVVLAFPSLSPSTSRRLTESHLKASRFGLTKNLGSPTLVTRDAYGYVVPTTSDYGVFHDATLYGGRVLLENDPKAHDGAELSPENPPGAKNQAGAYGKTLPIKEGTWLSLGKKVEGYQIEMHGTQPIGKPTRGDLHPGRYYVLGLEEAAGVVTLGKVASLAKIGNSEEGRYVYNVAVDPLREACDDPAKVGPGGGVLPTQKSLVKAREVTAPRMAPRKKEAVAGAGAVGAGAAATTAERVTTESTHSRGVRMLGLLREKGYLGEPTPRAATAQKVLTAAAPSRAAQPLTEGELAPLDPALEHQLTLFRHGVTSAATSLAVSSQVVTQMHEAQVADALDGHASVSPEIVARVQEAGIALADLSPADLTALQQAHAQDAVEDDAAAQTEDAVPGDTAQGLGLVDLLKQRGYANAEVIASKLEAGEPATDWFGLTGGSLQDAKRLQWELARKS